MIKLGKRILLGIHKLLGGEFEGVLNRQFGNTIYQTLSKFYDVYIQLVLPHRASQSEPYMKVANLTIMV